MIADKELIVFCDESDKDGAYYGNFYGGVLVGSNRYERITAALNDRKRELNLFGEIKWQKVSASYLDKYKAIVTAFFEEVRAGHLKVRIMFRQKAYVPTKLTREDKENQYFKLYYQFMKHAFGLESITPQETPIRLRLYFDQFPHTREKIEGFKRFLVDLAEGWRRKGSSPLVLLPENIAEVDSHDHVLLQCLDVVLGAMCFRLNDKHTAIPQGKKRRAKTTIAKEALYKHILSEIRTIRPNFNIGISTGIYSDRCEKWEQPYAHWNFISSGHEYREEMTKRGQKKNPVRPT